MAVFLARAYSLPDGPDPGFGDVASDAWYGAEVAALAGSGITRGCGDGTVFCPEQLTTRAEMATFLWRAEQPGDVSGGSAGFDPAVTPPLGDFDLERLVAASETLDPRAVCPALGVPQSLEDVVEVLRVDGGCAVVEYVSLSGRSFEEARAEILAGDPTAHAVGVPPIDIEPSAAQGLFDDERLPRLGGTALLHPVGGDEGHGSSYYSQAPPAPYDLDQYGPGQWWHLHRLDAETLWQPGGWEFTDETSGDTWQVPGWGGREVIVAVLDSGVAEHRDLDGALVGSGGMAHLSWLDDACHHNDRILGGESHGTSLAGVIAAVQGNGQDVAGLAPRAKILPINLIGKGGGTLPCKVGGTDITATVAVNAARERGVDVISMSFWWNSYEQGARETDCRIALLSLCLGRYDTFEAALRLAQLDGIVTVDSIDNCGDDPDNLIGTCPSGLNQRAFPSAYAGVIGVAAIDNTDDVADFSSRNQDVDIAAPGVNVFTTTRPDDLGLFASSVSGTSIASPLVSAVAAHMKARYPQASGRLISSALRQTARNPDTNRTGGPKTNEYGWGIVDPVAAIEQLARWYDEPIDTPPPVEGPTSVTVAPGASAQGQPGCDTRHCRHLSITLDAPDGTYDVECWSSLDDEPWGTGRWHWPSSSRWTQGGCWYGYPGEQVWVTVAGVMSNTITWPEATTSPQPTGAEIVSAGWWHSCGVRADGTITCWGSNQHTEGEGSHLEITWVSVYDGKLNAPTGRFVSVSVGAWHSCGVRTDQTITCWGDNVFGQTDAPAGRFTMVSAGTYHSCGVRTDQTVTCWGLNEYEYATNDEEHRRVQDNRAVAPSGRFTMVSAGEIHSCGVRTDQTITCWGDNSRQRTDAPRGPFHDGVRWRYQFVWCAHRPDHHLLGRDSRRSRSCGSIHHGVRRYRLFVWCANRWHRHLLGYRPVLRQCRWRNRRCRDGASARRPIHNSLSRPDPLVWCAHRSDRHLLGFQRALQSREWQIHHRRKGRRPRRTLRPVDGPKLTSMAW